MSLARLKSPLLANWKPRPCRRFVSAAYPAEDSRRRAPAGLSGRLCRRPPGSVLAVALDGQGERVLRPPPRTDGLHE